MTKQTHQEWLDGENMPPKPIFRLEPFRSGGFLNRDYDMGRVTIDLPIIEAKKLLAKLNK